MKLIGKMCKKNVDSKYFKNHIEEDNRIEFNDELNENYAGNNIEFEIRYENFKKYIENNKYKFII